MPHPRVFGVLAGRDMDLASFAALANSADVLIAADSGADHLREAGIKAHYIIGDLDSVLDLDFHTDAVIHRLSEQETSDFDKLLVLAGELGYTEITILGLEGDRADHVLASWISAARSTLKITVALRRGTGTIVRPDSPIQVSVGPGQPISLMPIGDCEGVTLEGVEWPLREVRLAWNARVSISNRAIGPVTARVGSGAAVLIAEHKVS